jgi:hypothetical protein
MTDFSSRVVTVAARLLPPERHEWGAAMVAELAHVHGPASRLRFSLGCVRAALFSPRLAVYFTPRIAVIAIVAGVIGCIATTAYVIAAYPVAAQELSRATWLSFALVHIGFLATALAPPRLLVVRQRVVRIGVLCGAVFFIVVRLGMWFIESARQAKFDDDVIGGLFMVFVFIGALVTCAAFVARNERSFRAGVIAAFWTGIVAALLGFSVDLIGTVNGLNFEAHLREVWPRHPAPTLDSFLRKHMGEHLAASMRGLVALPVLAVLVGSLGATIGKKINGVRVH